MTAWPWVIALFLIAAAFGTVVRVSNSLLQGRVAGVVAAVALLVVAVEVLRRQAWAFGAAFLLALCWFWAVVALGLQDRMGAGEVVMWLAWSLIVMTGTVIGRARRTDPGGG